MASVFARGSKLYAKIKDAAGRWQQVATGFSVGEEAKAERWAADREREASDARARAGNHDGPLTVRGYGEHWLERRTNGTVNDDKTRLRKHVYPRCGDVLLADFKPRHARDLIVALRAEGKLAPKTIRQISGLLHTMFKSAVIEEIVPSNPIVFERGVLPKKVDKDPTWRHEAIYTRDELEQMISDARILHDRRVLYALKTLSALRHGEVSPLGWAQYDRTTEPFAAINLGEVKSGVPRRVPVHPTLAAILDDWWARGWEQTYGRPPTPDDLIVPTRRMTVRAAAETQKQLIADLKLIGLRTKAGVRWHRRGHDLRRSMITVARADGAIDSWLRWVTHGPKANDMLDVYSSPSWEVLCTEIAKVRIGIRGAAVVQSPQPPVATNENERPQRDSNQNPTSRDHTPGLSLRPLGQASTPPSVTEWSPTAPRLGAAASELMIDVVDRLATDGDTGLHGEALGLMARLLRDEIVRDN